MITRAVLFERFAGRAAELHHLKTSHARSARAVSFCGVSIVGEAGVGKSRLIAEFETATRSERGVIIRARCEELPVAYGPIVAVLDRLAERRELSRIDSLAAARTSLMSKGMDTAVGADEQKSTMLDGIVAAISASAHRLGQLTIAVDDVHWSDLSSLEALKVLARAAYGLPLLLIVTYRPEDASEHHAKAVAIGELERTGFDRMMLQPLGRNEIVTLIREAVPTASGAASDRICELSEGKPYIAEELARSLTDGDGALESNIAFTLRSSVLQRVERLDPSDREIVDIAAVLGRNFLPGDLRALGASQERLMAALRAGSRLQLFEEREVEGTPWFRFRHALTREILYRNLLALERRALHRQIAEQIEATGGRSAELAYHRSLAGDTHMAVAANERAGDEAAQIAAHGDATILYRRALDFTNEAEARARIGLKLVRSLRLVEKQYDDYVPVTEGLVEELVRSGRREDAIRLLVADDGMRACTNRFADIVRWLDRAATLLDDSTPLDLRFDFEVLNAHCLAQRGKSGEALAACDRADAVLAAASPARRNRVLMERALAHVYAQRYADAQRALDARFIDPERREPREDALALSHQANVNALLGRFEESFAFCLEAVAIYERLGNDWAAWRQRYHACFYAAEIGDFAFIVSTAERARRDELERSDTLYAALLRLARANGGDVAPFLAQFEGNEERQMYFLHALGCDLPFMLDDRPEKARDVAMRAVDLMPPGYLDGCIVEAVLAFGSREDVARTLVRYRAEFDSDAPVPKLERLIVEARLAEREGRHDDAVAYGRAAIPLAETTKQWLHLCAAHELAGDVGAAREVLKRVGAIAELDRLDRRKPNATPAPVTRALSQKIALTRREMEVARAIAAGLSNREAAERLAMAQRTVETHLVNVYRKFGIGSRTELIECLGELDR